MIRLAQGSIAHRLLGIGAVSLAAGAALWAPTNLQTGTIGDVTRALELVIAAMALNLLAGYAGQISLGHSAFFGLGGYTTAILVSRYGWNPTWTLLPAALIAFTVGMAVAFPSLRLRGLHLALMTMTIAVLFPQVVKWQKLAWLTEGARGISNVTYQELPTWPLLGELSGRHGRALSAYWMTVIAVIICYLVCRGIVRSRVGRALIAIRDDELAAAAMGVHLARTKTAIYGVSAAMCAVAGSLATLRTTLISTEVTNVTVIGSVIFLLVMVLGGSGTLTGPIVGGLVFVAIDLSTKNATDSDAGVAHALFGWMDTSPAALLVAVALIGMMFAAPSGITGLATGVARRLVVIVPPPLPTSRKQAGAEPGAAVPAPVDSPEDTVPI